MLIRWATSNEMKKYGFVEDEYNDYNVLIAVTRMTNECLGILGFSREKKEISKIKIFDKQKEEEYRWFIDEMRKGLLSH
jgi:hypothetical protein